MAYRVGPSEPGYEAGTEEVLHGSGTPEGQIIAGPGRLYVDESGGAGEILYVKESGVDENGWVVYAAAVAAMDAPYTLAGDGDTVPLTINAAAAQTAKLQSWKVNSVEKAYITAAGVVTADVVGDVTGNLTGDVTGDVTGGVTAAAAGDITIGGVVAVRKTAAPAAANSTGTLGDIAEDDSYLYVCTATNTWKRVAIETWA